METIIWGFCETGLGLGFWAKVLNWGKSVGVEMDVGFFDRAPGVLDRI